MNGSGCKNCPVKPCHTLHYRGSDCSEQRAKHGLGDPQTNADKIRAMTDEELAQYLVAVESRRRGDGCGAIWGLPYVALEWLQQPVEDL